MGIYSTAYLGFGWSVEYPEWETPEDQAAPDLLDEWLSEHGRGYLSYADVSHYEDPDGHIIWFLVKSADFFSADCWDHKQIEAFHFPREKSIMRAAEEANEFLEAVGDEQRIDPYAARWLLGADVG